MRRLLSILPVICFSTLNAQMCPCDFGGKSSEKPLRNEIGLNLINKNEILINFHSDKSVYLQNYANGVMIKHHFDKFSIRAGFDYFENTFTYQTIDEKKNNYNLNNGQSFGKDFRMGAEKTLLNKKLQPYGGADILLTIAKFSGISEGYGDLRPPYKTPYAFNVLAIGISPAIGLKYRPIKHFSLTLETSISIVKYKTYKSTGYPSEKFSDILSNPLRVLSFNYHF